MGVETALLIAAAVSAGTAIYSGVQAKETADVNAELQNREAEATKVTAMTQAEKIRRAGRAQVSEANAALAASGVAIGEGTPIAIGQKILSNSESDAYATILSGKRRAGTLDDQAAITSWQGQASQKAGFANAGASLLSAGAKSYNGWKTPAAPIVERSSYGASQ